MTSWRSRSGRLSGLLSGCPPTDTRPQARAKLGKRAHNGIATVTQVVFPRVANFSRRRSPNDRGLKSCGVAQLLLTNGSTRCALRTKATITATPTDEEHGLERVDAVVAEAEQVGDGPAARVGGAEHLGADQDRGAEHRDDARPVDAAARRPLNRLIHGCRLHPIRDTTANIRATVDATGTANEKRQEIAAALRLGPGLGYPAKDRRLGIGGRWRPDARSMHKPAEHGLNRPAIRLHPRCTTIAAHAGTRSGHGPPYCRTSPRRRRRAAPRGRRSRPRRPRRRRQRDRGDDRDGGRHRGGVPAHEPHRRRRLLAVPRAVRAASARSMAAGFAGERARAASSIASSETIPPRGPLAALTVPGAIGGWALALEAARGARRPACRSTALLAPAIRHAREGYTVTRSQARLTAEKLAELKDVPGFAAAFLADGKPPAAGAMLRQHALAATLDHLANAGPRRLLSRRRRTRDRRRPRPHRQPGDARRPRALSGDLARRRWSCRVAAATLYNTPPPTQGLASLIILGLFERAARHARPKASTTSTASSRRPSAPSGCAIGTSPTPSRAHRIRPTATWTAAFLDGEAAKIDRPQGGARGRRRRAKATPSGWARPTRPASSSPTSSRSIGNSARAACSRATGVLMQNRGASFSLDPRRREPARARPPSVPHAQSGARGAQGWPRHGVRHHGRRRPAAVAGRAVHPPRHVPPAARRGDRARRAGCSAAPGARRTPTCGWRRASTTT